MASSSSSSSNPDPGLVDAGDENFEFVVVHRRGFQKYALDHGAYYCPVDEDEIEALEIMHGVLQRVFDDRLIFPPISSPRRILDCGYGTGHWAMQVALQYPRCQVIGVDISSHMTPEEADRPANFEPQMDDLNSSFTFQQNYFDLVHSQLVAGGIHSNQWPRYIADIFRVLRRRGWCQMVEIYFNAQSDNGSLTEGHALSQWSKEYLRSVRPMKDPRAPLHMDNWLRNAGFVDVETRVLNLPTCSWPRDHHQRQIGADNNENVKGFLESMAIYPFTEFRGMSIEDVQMLVARARHEASEPQLRTYFPLYVTIGRKP